MVNNPLYQKDDAVVQMSSQLREAFEKTVAGNSNTGEDGMMPEAKAIELQPEFVYDPNAVVDTTTKHYVEAAPTSGITPVEVEGGVVSGVAEEVQQAPAKRATLVERMADVLAGKTQAPELELYHEKTYVCHLGRGQVKPKGTVVLERTCFAPKPATMVGVGSFKKRYIQQLKNIFDREGKVSEAELADIAKLGYMLKMGEFPFALVTAKFTRYLPDITEALNGFIQANYMAIRQTRQLFEEAFMRREALKKQLADQKASEAGDVSVAPMVASADLAEQLDQMAVAEVLPVDDTADKVVEDAPADLVDYS